MLHPACAYGVESHRRHWWLLSPPRYQFPRHQNRQRHSPYLVLYVYDWPAVLPSASCPRQCRTGWPKAPQATSTAGSGNPYDVRKGVIRRQAVGLSGRAVQCVRMGLRATGILRRWIVACAVSHVEISPAPPPVAAGTPNVCLWLAICSTDNVVSPTVPDRHF